MVQSTYGCFTCSCMRPRYKRLVDNIFPANPQDGLVKTNMEKLTFYSLSSPEKLDRIGEYIFQRASRDISRKKTCYVIIAMEAMDQLLSACHSQTLNLFVESFLRMVQKLLESTEPDLQVLATNSFVKFANIEEDTPSYHRRYDFFVSKFSSMCHNNATDIQVRKTLRLAGIRGLQGVIRKTVSDDLVENIWEPVHMDKILPSLLFNMQESERYPEVVGCCSLLPCHNKLIQGVVSLTGVHQGTYYKGGNGTRDDRDPNEPGVLADTCIRELVGRASFGHVGSLLRPVLRHLDQHSLWVPNEFAVHTFRIIMSSIQTQYSYAVVENLMSHLDSNINSSAKIRTSIVNVLSKIIAISAEESVGPSVLEIINSLVGHLKNSVTKREDFGEEIYREALISCLGEFSAHLPDYQKVEIMVFIVSKVPVGDVSGPEKLLQEMLLKSLLIISKKYTNVSMTTTFPVLLLEPMLRLCGNLEMTTLVQGVFHTLLDRQGNLEKLRRPRIYPMHLKTEPCSRADTVFIRKYGEDIYGRILDAMSLPGNSLRTYSSLYTTLALVAIELISLSTITSYLTAVYSIQEVATTQAGLSTKQKFHLHAICITLLHLILSILQIQPLGDYCDKVIEQRKNRAPYLLPDLKEDYGNISSEIEPDLLLDQNKVESMLRESGLDTGVLTRALTHRHSWVENTSVSMKGSVTDLNNLDLDSANSTPGLQRKYPEEELSFEAMKRILSDNNEQRKAENRRKQAELCLAFRTTAFSEIVNNNTVKDEDTLQTKLMELLQKNLPPVNPLPLQTDGPIYEVLFPELFAY
nr:protein EFR3 homolog cmp44E isoform X1 [Halyomorpha halys]